jgi:DNA-binding transcriptional LysR family regulator
VTTSAVSQQLAKLEAETGQTLLERHGRGVRLTDAAATLVSRTHRVLSLWKKPRPSSKPRTPRCAGRSTMCRLRNRRARDSSRRPSARCSRNNDQLVITFHEQEPHESIPRLVRREVDVIIINDWQNAPIALPEGLTKAPSLMTWPTLRYRRVTGSRRRKPSSWPN